MAPTTENLRREAAAHIFVALDKRFEEPIKTERQLLELVDPLCELGVRFKIRPSLVYRFDISTLLEMGIPLDGSFFDPKLHDIGESCVDDLDAILSRFVPRFVSCHLSSSTAMQAKLIARSLQNTVRTTRMVGITVLTDIDPDRCQRLFCRTTAEQVKTLINESAGIGHIVCSPQEVKAVKALWPHIKVITPGIRPAEGELNDQKRTGTPRQAIMDGANYLVIGRPITGKPDPKAAAEALIDEVAQALADRKATA